MIKIFTDFFTFIWKPKLEKDANNNVLYILQTFVVLLSFSFFVAFTLLIIIGILTALGLIEQGKHALDNLFDGRSTLWIFFLAAVIAPVVEELIFRAPLVLFKKVKTFRIAFYSFALLFGYVHLSNFEITTNALLFSPILVAPQIYLGLVLGYMRVRFGLIWSILMHAVYNGILISISLLAIDAIK